MEDNLDSVSSAIFEKTCGHPRQILELLSNCDSEEAIDEYRQDLTADEWHTIARNAKLYSDVIGSRLLPFVNSETESVNLQSLAHDQHAKSVSLETIASSVMIGWSGSITNAYLFASEQVKEYLENVIRPLSEYLIKLSKSRQVPLDTRTVGHLANQAMVTCAKRLGKT